MFAALNNENDLYNRKVLCVSVTSSFFGDLGLSSVDNNEDDFILCCDFVVLSVRLLQTSPWHTLVDTALEGFHLMMMVVMIMLVMTMMLITMTVRIIDRSPTTLFPNGRSWKKLDACFTLKLRISFERCSWPISRVALTRHRKEVRLLLQYSIISQHGIPHHPDDYVDHPH